MKVGTIVHWRPYDPSNGNKCWAAMVIGRNNDMLNLEVTAPTGSKFIERNKILNDDGSILMAAHTFESCTDPA